MDDDQRWIQEKWAADHETTGQPAIPESGSDHQGDQEEDNNGKPHLRIFPSCGIELIAMTRCEQHGEGESFSVRRSCAAAWRNLARLDRQGVDEERRAIKASETRITHHAVLCDRRMSINVISPM
jgi:hypothetical protein